MSTEPPPPTRADVGVLFVHGMGDQQRGDTLIQFGEPVQRWLERWLRDQDGSSAVRVTRAELSERGESRPAHAELHLQANGRNSTWLLAESWWAESFRAPTYADLWRWSIDVVPLAVAEHFVRRFRLASAIYLKIFWLFVALGATALLPVLTVVMVTSLVLGVLPIERLRAAILRLQKVLIGTVGDSYALLESSIRDAAMSSCVVRDLEWLKTAAKTTVVVAHSQGAAVTHAALQSAPVRPDLLFTFGSGLRKLLMLDVIRGSNRAMAWLPPLGLLLMAVGSWVGYRLIVDPSWRVDVMSVQMTPLLDPINRIIGFDIVGWRSVLSAGALGGLVLALVSGEGSLIDRILIAVFGAAFGVLIVGFLKSIMVAGPPGYVATMLVMGGGWMLAQGFAILEGGAYSTIEKRLKLDPTMHWVDIYASRDPVPNGPLTGTPNNAVTSDEVNNLGSMLRDHSSYWRNVDEFVSSVALAIAAPARVDLTTVREWDRDRLSRVSTRRRWRVGWLTPLRIAASVVGVLLALRVRQGPWHQADDLPHLLRVMFLESVDLLEKIPFLRLLLGAGTKTAVVQALWPVSLLFVVWLIYQLFLFAWSWWDRHETDQLFDRRDYTMLPIPFIVLLASVAGLIGVSIVLASAFDRAIWQLWDGDPGVAALRSEFWKTLYHPPLQGAVAALMVSLLASSFGGFAAAVAADHLNWRAPRPDQVLYAVAVGRALLALAVVAPVAWLLYDLNGNPPSPRPGITTSAGNLGVAALLAALAFITNASVDVFRASSPGQRLVDWLYASSASGPLGVWLARAGTNGADRLMRRAGQMLAEWNALDSKARSVRVVADYNREAAAIVRDASFSSHRDHLLALTDSFPYAALIAAESAAETSPDLARRILEPHRKNSPGRVRWRIRGIDKRLARSAPQPQVV